MKKKGVHFEIGCSDIAATSAFYQNVFDWNIEPIGRSAAINATDPEYLPGHLNQLDPKDPQQYITVYIETDDIEADLAAVEANGGQRKVGPIPLPDGRSFAWFIDVAGNIVGLITPKPWISAIHEIGIGQMM